jgi:hypothetical protein
MNTTPTFRICRKEVYAVATFGSPLPTHFERFVADANGDYIEKDYGTAQSYRHVSDCNPCAVAKLRATAGEG